MSGSSHLSGKQIHASLKHPVIDTDAHWLEYAPVIGEDIRRIGGDKAAEGFHAVGKARREVRTMSVAERRRRRISQDSFWSSPSRNTRDYATALLPRLLYERLDELGLDFSVVYPSIGVFLPRLADDQQRRAVCRAFNIMTSEYFRGFDDRMAPAAVIPTFTPEEAIEELEFCTKQLNLKVAMFGSLVPRPVPSAINGNPEAARFTVWYDTLALDSEYDYDPVWAKCLELGIVPTFHAGSRRMGLRLSPTNFTYNHIGHFGTAGDAVCKAVFLGGVTRRFPGLNFGFLEGGVGFACMLFNDLVGHWSKRNIKALEHTDPRSLDRKLLMELVEKHGYSQHAAALRERDGWPNPDSHTLTGGIADLDDYAACKITRKEDWADLFAKPFYFGCESDDRVNAWAFNRRTNPFGTKLNAIFGSDISHFDVPDMLEVLPEAYELVEHELISLDDFRDFTFENAVRLWGTGNPRFFEGTVVAKAAAEVLAKSKSAAQAVAA